MLWCISGSVYAADNLYYVPQGTIKEQLKEGIEYTRHSIDVCIHNFAALDIGKDLEAARVKGVRVRMVILSYDNNRRGLLAETLIHKGFDVRVLKPQMGDKLVQDFFLLDDRILVTGVYNWLAYQNRNICHDVVFHYDINKIRNYKNTFYRLFTEGEIIPFLASQTEQEIKSLSPVSGITPFTLDKKQSIQESLSDEKPVVPKEPEGIMDERSRDSLDISFEELDKQFSKKSMLTRSEKNELWKKYKGKYVRWHGIVSYKGMGRVDWNRIGISQKNDKGAEVEILFDWKKFEKVMNIRIGNTITYTGRLVSYPKIDAPYRLDDGDIE